MPGPWRGGGVARPVAEDFSLVETQSKASPRQEARDKRALDTGPLCMGRGSWALGVGPAACVAEAVSRRSGLCVLMAR